MGAPEALADVVEKLLYEDGVALTAPKVAERAAQARGAEVRRRLRDWMRSLEAVLRLRLTADMIRSSVCEGETSGEEAVYQERKDPFQWEFCVDGCWCIYLSAATFAYSAETLCRCMPHPSPHTLDLSPVTGFLHSGVTGLLGLTHCEPRLIWGNWAFPLADEAFEQVRMSASVDRTAPHRELLLYFNDR